MNPEISIFYEIAMSIGKSLDLEDMLKQAITVILRKLNYSAGGVHLYMRPGNLQPKLRSFLIPRIFAGSDEFAAITEIVEELTSKRLNNDDPGLFEPCQFKIGTSYILIMEMPETGFIFFDNQISEYDKSVIMPLQELVGRLSAACIACYQNDALIQSQYDLELRIAHRTKELEESNTELKDAYEKLQKAQKQLIHSEKMISLGQLAAGVAHEINNPTGYIQSNLHTMAEYLDIIEEFYRLTTDLVSGNAEDPDGTSEKIRRLAEDEDMEFIINDAEGLVKDSIDGSDRIKEIVTGLRNFGRSDDDSDFTLSDPNDSIEDALRLTWNELKYKCEVEKDLGALVEIPCRTDQLTQVFVNMLVNAVQAIESHGKIRVESRLEKKSIVIKISDNGKGIPEEYLSKLFDPFFTTKKIGQGTGLGLSISHGIIEAHGGSIEVDSSPGVGTTFTIMLPIS